MAVRSIGLVWSRVSRVSAQGTCAVLVLLLLPLLLQAAPVLQAQEPARPLPAAPGGTWHIRSPYPSLSRTRQLLDVIGLEVLGAYAPADERDARRRLASFPGAQASRLFVRPVDGALRVVEVVAVAHPAGGYEIYVRGADSRDGVEAVNPEMAGLEEGITRVVQSAGLTGDAPPGRRALGYETYQLSYVEPDRALAALKAMDYSTVEFEENQGETIYDRIFVPRKSEQLRLPVVIKLVAASKTSLQESTSDSGAYAGSREGLPDLGGIFLHRVTAADPQNRLLIAYDPDDIESLQTLVNLLTDVIDVPARQIMMEALVIEIQGDLTRDLGVSWGVKGKSFDVEVAEEQRLVTTPLTFTFNQVRDALTFTARLHALLETSKARILSNPSVLVLDGRQAKIQIGNRIPVVETTVTSSSATESVLYFPVGIVLNLRPRVNKQGDEISMQVETIVSAARQTLASAGSSTRAPEVESRQVQTFVRVQNDTPFIIGGLTTNDEVRSRRGVPLFSSIPFIGPLFSRDLKETVKKEIIIVVTPHLVPEDPKTFSFVIPQSSSAFDAFGRQLLYNAYRVRQQDVFDLDFVLESRAYTTLVDCARRYASAAEDRWRIPPDAAALLNGSVPGEDILVRRMLWEIIRKTAYYRHVSLDRVVFFESPADGGSDFQLAFLAPKEAERKQQGRSSIVLTFNARNEGTPEHPFGQPAATLSYEDVTARTFASRLAAGNRRNGEGDPETWSLILSDPNAETSASRDTLRGVMVLKAVLALNPNLRLTIREFRAGKQIVFPTETELTERWNLIDPEVAKLFYEVNAYYPAFEEEFKVRARRVAREMGGCSWWEGVPPARQPQDGGVARDAAPATPPRP